MPSITINGTQIEFDPGINVLQLAIDHGIEIPHYCYHESLSIPANCRICLAEVWQPNPRNENKLESMGKLIPTCSLPAADGMVIDTETPKAIGNQKAVMEYLLINHPVDCPVCDQAGECHLQDYSYQYGRGQSRFQEDKNKQPKKDIGPNVLLYSDRCIMCTRCVRFTREVTGTDELFIDGRGSQNQIDVFPGAALDNELASNVIDLCPVGALLDKDFLFQQRVWYLKSAASIDPITASGDNIYVEYNDAQVYRVKPRQNDDVNGFWITDEVRYGWKFVHAEDRIEIPAVAGEDVFDEKLAREAWSIGIAETNRLAREAVEQGSGLAMLVSPMLSCEDAFLLATWAQAIDPKAIFGVGPVLHKGEEKTFPGGFRTCSEKAPNARGVRMVLEACTSTAPLEVDAFFDRIAKGIGCLVVTGNQPSAWVTEPALDSIKASGANVIQLDTLPNRLTPLASVVLPTATFAEKSGTFQNRDGRLQAFERAIAPLFYCKSECQLALDLIAALRGESSQRYDAVAVRTSMAGVTGLEAMSEVQTPVVKAARTENDQVLIPLNVLPSRSGA